MVVLNINNVYVHNSLVSATSCCRSYRSYRMLLHEWWWEKVSSIISPRCFADFTGCSSHQCIRFKLAMIVDGCLHGLAPLYLADDCVLVSSVASRRHLRSADTRKLVVWWTQTVISAWNFALRCTIAWNSLPIDLWVSSLFATTFARHLKACLFRRPS